MELPNGQTATVAEVIEHLRRFPQDAFVGGNAAVYTRDTYDGVCVWDVFEPDENLPAWQDADG